jgi:hypothetical protein
VALDLEDLHGLAVDDDRVLGVADLTGVGAVGRVVLEQQGVGLDVDEVVDGDHLDVGRALDERLEGLAADAAEAVDADTSGHRETSWNLGRRSTSARAGALDGKTWRTAERTLRCPRAIPGRGDVGSAASTTRRVAVTATPKAAGAPPGVRRAEDRRSRGSIPARRESMPGPGARAVSADRV